MVCEDIFPRMLMTMTSFRSSFRIQYSSAGEIKPNSIVDGILEDYTRYLSTFPLKSSFSIVNDKQEKKPPIP